MINTTEKRKPAATVRDGNLKIVLWPQEGQHGPYFTANFVRSYKTENGWNESSSIRATDLPRLASLAQLAYIELMGLQSLERAKRMAQA